MFSFALGASDPGSCWSQHCGVHQEPGPEKSLRAFALISDILIWLHMLASEEADSASWKCWLMISLFFYLTTAGVQSLNRKRHFFPCWSTSLATLPARLWTSEAVRLNWTTLLRCWRMLRVINTSEDKPQWKHHAGILERVLLHQGIAKETSGHEVPCSQGAKGRHCTLQTMLHRWVFIGTFRISWA